MKLQFDAKSYRSLHLCCLYAEEKKIPLSVEQHSSKSICIAESNSGKLVEKGEIYALLEVGTYLRLMPDASNIVPLTEVEHWLNYVVNTLNLAKHDEEIEGHMRHLEAKLKDSYIVDKRLSIADLVLFSSLIRFHGKYCTFASFPNLKRYFTKLLENESFCKLAKEANIPCNAPKGKASGGNQPKANSPRGRKQEGKYIDLPGAEMGKVVVRFPPEASGYLHIGHAKAALLNQNYQQSFQGKLILRFDDTNPAKETEHFEEIILEDLKKLGVKYDVFTRTSDHFDRLLGFCEQLMKQGDAYVDNTDPETMKKQREAREESACRSNTVEQNFKMWEEMKKGSAAGQQYCVRAKIDMKNDNGCLRDPTLYRCKAEEHVATGGKYKVYPTYDFACPVVDSIEGVTHALRTTEYHDRDSQYYWVIDKLGIRKPYIWEYSRLNLQNTVMSKRKLTWLVDNGYVTGWDDPRFPTVRGVFRRGMTVEGLKEFVIAQGSSKSVVTMDWSKIWAFNKQVIDPIAPRYVAIVKENAVEISVEGAQQDSSVQFPKHPKNPAVGEKAVWRSKKILIDQADAAAIKEGEVATFVNWGNMIVKKITKSTNGKPEMISSVDCKLNLENTDYKNTQKFTWLPLTSSAPLIPVVCVHFGPLLTKSVLLKDEDFKSCVNTDSLFKFEMLGEAELAHLKKGDIIQLMRRGFYIVDEPYRPPSPNTCCAQPCVLFHVPDGHVKELPTSVTASSTASAKPTQPAESEKDVGGASAAHELNAKITDQGNKIRKLKQEKATKAVIDPEVKVLLSLKAEFLKVAGQDWTPNIVLPAIEQNSTGMSDESKLDAEITAQGNKIRQLKQEKAEKGKIDAEVKMLLSLKADYKKVAGKDWAPGSTAKPKVEEPAKPALSGGNDAGKLHEDITKQGDKIRGLKGQKAEKSIIEPEVKLLLALKTEFKSLTGKDWTPGSAPPTQTGGIGGNTVDKLNADITEQGDRIRGLKSQKADKSVIDAEVKVLLALKAEYKNVAGKDWTPGSAPPTFSAGSGNSALDKLNNDITKQGDKIRNLKGQKADKSVIDAEVKILLALKAEYKNVAGKDWVPASAPASKPKQEQAAPKLNQPKKKEEQSASSAHHKITKLGLEARKEDNFADWYTQVITKAELIEYYDVSGCYVLRPTAFAIWERIQAYFDAKIKAMGVENCYFPIFVSRAALEREKTHIADFAPEVAWVTRSGQSEMAEPIAIRPTSETVMYPSYARWVQSYRDLPIKLNQWCSVVRWEFKNPSPFIRTREFLWQEGHTAFATFDEAKKEVYEILDHYADIYERLLAIPVIKGKKSKKETFAGADFTLTTELYIPLSGRGLQGATSHHLGQNFSKMFNIEFEDPENPARKEYAYQNAWGISTRSIGALIMIHGDNNGLVLPPRVAITQVVIVPVGITVNTKEEMRSRIFAASTQLADDLKKAGLRVKADLRDHVTPGWKFNDWELKGIPLRIELGPRDLEKQEFVLVRRDTGEKLTRKLTDAANGVPDVLEQIQQNLFNKAKESRDSHTVTVTNWTDFCDALALRHIMLAPFCGDVNCEEVIKNESAKESQAGDGTLSMGAKTLCTPFDQPPLPAGIRCINPHCRTPTKVDSFALFGRSY